VSANVDQVDTLDQRLLSKHTRRPRRAEILTLARWARSIALVQLAASRPPQHEETERRARIESMLTLLS
jgi:hypothetical protein